MNKILFVEYCAKDFIADTFTMSNDEELAYRRICDLIYTTNDNLLDNDSLKYSTKMGKKWKAIRESLITQHGAIFIKDGFIHVKKCSEKLLKSNTSIEQKRHAGKVSSEKRKSLKNKDSGSTAVDTAVITAVPTNHKPNNQVKEKDKKEKDKSKSSKDDYWWEGDVIKLNRKDYESWFKIYGGTDNQFMEWLWDRDLWMRKQAPQIKKNWFLSTFKAVQKVAA